MKKSYFAGKFFLGLLTALFFCAPSFAEDKPYVVLALSGGGIKGYAHIGVLEVLEREGIGVAGVVGTSMGSIVGSIYASGMSTQEMEKIVSQVNLGELVTASAKGYFDLSEQSYRDLSIIRPELQTNAKNDVVGPLGFVSGTAVLEYIAGLLSHVTVTDFSKLPIPFAAVATDLETGEKVVLRHGSLASAVRASMSIPGVFDPWEVNGRLLVDGGMVSNMPVETAKELFPGYPVIAVNLTSELDPREKMNNLISVLNQSITILTMQNVRREAALADVVINPNVKDYPMLGTSPAGKIIEEGRIAAREALPQIRAIAENAPRKPIKPKNVRPASPIVKAVHVTGVPAQMSADLERELMGSWKDHPVSMKKIIEASSSIAKREDVRSVDYDLEENEDGTTVILKVQRLPAHIYRLGGYGSTLAGQGWMKIEARSYDLVTPGDTLQSRFYLSDNWGGDFNYFWGMDVRRENFWEAGVSATRYKIDPEGHSQHVRWQRYAFNVQRHFTLQERLHVAAGATAAAVRRVEGDENFNYIAPFVDATLNLMDDPEDPVNGLMVDVHATWPDEIESWLLRATLTGRSRLSSRFMLELSGGYTEGETSDNRLFAAYLGAREELYTLADHPIESERFLWWRAKLRYPLMDTILGSVIAELFGGQGFAYDDSNSLIDNPWEAGFALCAPRKLLEARLYAAYTDRDEWRFGASIGVPDWDVFHLF